MHRNDHYRRLVERAGGIFVGVQSGFGIRPDAVLFQRIPGGSTLSIYSHALHTVQDVELALKADLEKFTRKEAAALSC